MCGADAQAAAGQIVEAADLAVGTVYRHFPDRNFLLEELSRTFSESGINIVEARCIVTSPMVKNTFVVEVGDTRALKATVNRLRNIDGVFDAYRVTPGAG